MARKVKTNAVSSETAIMRSRLAGFMGYSHAGERDLYEVFGYSRQPNVRELFALYTRNGVANRIVRAFPQATWNKCPKVCDEAGNNSDRDSDGYSAFTEAAEDLFERKQVLRYIERADRVSSIGRFGLMVMGMRDGLPLSSPLVSKKAPLLYLAPYCETSVRVHRYDEDSKSERYGKPLSYAVQNGGDLMIPGGSGRTAHKGNQIVHWTRAIHISEFLEEDEVYGMPRLLPVLNYMKDLEKVSGGGAELFWLNANRGMIFSADPTVNLDDTMVQAIKDQAAEFQHQLRRYLVGQGITATPLGSDVAENDRNIDKLLDLISGSVGIPKRILTGSERGELSSSQDESNWSQRIDERRNTFATPTILRPFVQRLIDTGNLPAPKGEWWIEWPDEGELSPSAAVDIMVKKVQALAQYVSTPGAELLVTPTEFRSDVLGMSPLATLDDSVLDQDVPEDAEDVAQGDMPPRGDKPTVKANARPRTAYVSRKVMNGADIIAWAKAQGFKDLVDAESLHVTVAYTGIAFDWMRAGAVWDEEITFNAGGPRAVEIFGDGVAAIEFPAESLTWRHSTIMHAAGVIDEQQGYKPHITFSDTADVALMRTAEPYAGRIVLGPEVWQEIH